MTTQHLSLDAPVESVSRPVLRLFRRYASPHRRLVVIGIFATLLYPVLSLFPVYLLQTAIDGILLATDPPSMPGVPDHLNPTSRIGHLGMVATLMVGTAAAAAGLSVVSTLSWGRFAQEVQHAIRIDAFAAVERRGVAFVEGQQTGQLMTVLNDDVAQCNRLLEQFIRDIIETAARFLGISLVLFVLHWQFALVALCVLPPTALVARWFVRRVRPSYRALRERVGVFSARLENALNGIDVVKAAAADRYELDRVRESSRDIYDAQWRVIRAQAGFFPTISAINWFTFGTLVVLGGVWYLQGPPWVFTNELSIGVLVAFLLCNQMLATPLMQASNLVDVYFEASAAVARILSLFDEHEARPQEIAMTLDDVDGSIDFEDVRFTYPGDRQPALDGIDFTIEPASTVGIVGPTGSGKTTLLSLLLRFYDPTSGCIRLDGSDLRETDPTALRLAIGYVPQTPYLFSGTIRENVTYPGRQAGDEAIEAVLREAQAWEFVTDLPDGVETPVGHAGVNLSGGQRQRIAIARALLDDPTLLFLDEATSNLDLATEAALHRALTRNGEVRTTVIVAHRLSSVRHADQIVVLDGGRIVERGTHDELVREGGEYADLWNASIGNGSATTPSHPP